MLRGQGGWGAPSRHVATRHTTKDQELLSINGQAFLDLKQELKNINIEVVDITGRVIYEKKYNKAQGKTLIDGNLKRNRVYIINLSGKDYQKVFKILLE